MAGQPEPSRGILGQILHDMADFVGLVAHLVSDDAMCRAVFGFSLDVGVVSDLTSRGSRPRRSAWPGSRTRSSWSCRRRRPTCPRRSSSTKRWG
jgi:hypothetical protein